MHYLIIGNGVAGTKAAETIRRRDPDGRITILSAEEQPFYRRPALVDYLLGDVSRQGLLARPESFYRQARIELRLGTPAVGLEPSAHRLLLAGGEALTYDRLLLAVGVELPPAWLPGADLAGVFTLRTLADAEALRQAVPRARRAVVVGEGVTGLEMIRALRRLGLAVSYLLEGARFWAGTLSAEASALVEELSLIHI